MFLLTEGPRLFYVDPANLILKGEVPWYYFTLLISKHSIQCNEHKMLLMGTTDGESINGKWNLLFCRSRDLKPEAKDFRVFHIHTVSVWYHHNET